MGQYRGRLDEALEDMLQSCGFWKYSSFLNKYHPAKPFKLQARLGPALSVSTLICPPSSVLTFKMAHNRYISRSRACACLGILLQFTNATSFVLNLPQNCARPYHHVKEMRGMLKSDLDANNDLVGNLSFSWAEPRSEEEITEFCSKTLFPELDVDIARKRIKVVSADLPLVVIENMISDEMCEEIIQAAQTNGMMRSTIGDSQEKAEMRTSSTRWLRESHCEIPLRVLAGKASRLSRIPAEHMENLQVVRYEPGQKFDMHIDQLDAFNDLDCRGRLATCLLYLNSSRLGDPERGSFDGGETHFPAYNISVVPKRGRAVFWFNTIEKPGQHNFRNDMPLTADLKSRHAGKAVINGEKWVCNRWIHPVPLLDEVRDDRGLII